MANFPKILTGERLRGVGAAWLMLGVGWAVVGIITADNEAGRYVLGGIVAVLGIVTIAIGTVILTRSRRKTGSPPSGHE